MSINRGMAEEDVVHVYNGILVVVFSCPVVSNSLWSHVLQHSRHLCPSPFPKVCPSSCPLDQWCHPAISSSDALFFPQSFPVSGTFPKSQPFLSGDQNTGVSVSASVLPKGLISLEIDWFDLLAVQETLRSLPQYHSWKASILQDPDFITVQLSQSNVTAGKTIALTIQIFVSIVMSLFFNTMSRFEVFLSRGKHLLSSWMQSPNTGILEPKKRKSVTTSTFFPLCLPWSMGLYAMSLIFSYLVVSQLFTFFWWLR